MHGVFLTATQSGVFEDVTDACVVFTRSSEGNTGKKKHESDSPESVVRICAI